MELTLHMINNDSSIELNDSEIIIKGEYMMHDLKKVKDKFYEYLKSRINEKVYRIEEIKITEDLLKKEDAFYISFRQISYFLVIKDEKPVLYANVCSRMDLDVVAFIDEWI